MSHTIKIRAFILTVLALIIDSGSASIAGTHYVNSCGETVYNRADSGYEYIRFSQKDVKTELLKRRSSGVNQDAIAIAKNLQRKFGVFTRPTPLYTNQNINAFAKRLLHRNIVVYMKDETVNPTGSFKDRMPIRFYGRIDKYLQEVKKNAQRTYDLKVIAVSTGNHGRAVANAVNVVKNFIRQQGLEDKIHVEAEITMPANVLPHKKAAILRTGAKIRDHYPESASNHSQKAIAGYDDAENLVVNEAKSDPEHVMLLLHADKYAINGYAVIAEEIKEQARHDGLDFDKMNPGEALMLVPLGSGGILSGTEELSAQFPSVYSIGVTAAPADLTYRSLKTCRFVRSAEPYAGKLIVDGVMATPEQFSLKRIREISHEVTLVQQKDALYASALLKKYGISIEPTSGLPLAALLLGVEEHYKNSHYAFVVLTGRNISPDMESTISKLARQDEQVLFDYFKHRRNDIAGKVQK
ncbi:threonine dehydratase [Legionella geestiana]|uniref:Threonine dehydratase n=1 Tax=Legionella geestiana TaxID=45065 RepID=A0A0W0TTU0_9GAMM|nr:PLP-dependent lyase/thiolase [Legionella geestiana]KTC99037.1 threonine dehydratase [Legionella geestiana]QBS12631.1 PLP-dependent lyase/thiolase [Legionella geestiana]QDQ39651.1 PLP-dependent lyase/thiolase [Legionella geestiana]STX54909.1 threonine dehydratase [Legionella geestiana]